MYQRLEEDSVDIVDLDEQFLNDTHRIIDLDDTHKSIDLDDTHRSIDLDDTHRITENSPIPEVAATVSTCDDSSLPCLTFRFWMISTFFTILSASIAQFYFFRANTLPISLFFVQLTSFAIGKWMEWLPNWNILGMNINPGPFNYKEHCLIVVAASTSSWTAYAIDIISKRILQSRCPKIILSSRFRYICRHFFAINNTVYWIRVIRFLEKIFSESFINDLACQFSNCCVIQYFAWDKNSFG